ncbi:hypothetical protein CFD26_107063 [Aspergillus turcosus]|uniref:Uncharacterized protein n=1 Tax=Aspergillus turcosus TaxID=1245748 RepID=A0A421D5G4_9EURO|nr:hypothetical protein CFD26_107063 [Aspergillus turcosus]
MSQMGKDSTFQAPDKAQSQAKPGLEKEMKPSSESTKLESQSGFKEYVGSGKLKGKSVLITGGDSGIGRAVAALMAREGANISIVYLPEEEEDAQETKRLVEAENKEGACPALRPHQRPREQRLEAMHMYFAQIDLDKVEDVFRTNIIQMIAVTKFALPYMDKGDSIINNTSVTTFRGSSSMVDYAATKGAIVGFTRSLAAQLIPKGIRVNAVAPGAIYTPIQVDTRDAEQMEGWGSQHPLGRPGEPSEVATSFVFLASADASLYYQENSIYFYNPSLGASILFTIIYIIPLIYQSYMTFIFPRKSQTPHPNYFIPAVICAALEVAGYAVRCASVQKPADVALYTVSSTVIVIAPVFLCASLYMLLGKLETSPADGGNKKPESFVFGGSGRWLPWVFVTLDILAVLTQGSGSGIASSGNCEGSTKDAGIGVLIGGLVLQVVTFAVYLLIMIWFHWRAMAGGHQLEHGVRMVMKGVYIGGFFIMLRSIYRVFEFAFGIDSYMFTHEWPLYVLEAVPMLVALMVLGWFHPARWLVISGVEVEQTYSLRKSSRRRRRHTEEQSLA